MHLFLDELVDGVHQDVAALSDRVGSIMTNNQDGATKVSTISDTKSQVNFVCFVNFNMTSVSFLCFIDYPTADV